MNVPIEGVAPRAGVEHQAPILGGGGTMEPADVGQHRARLYQVRGWARTRDKAQALEAVAGGPLDLPICRCRDREQARGVVSLGACRTPPPRPDSTSRLSRRSGGACRRGAGARRQGHRGDVLNRQPRQRRRPAGARPVGGYMRRLMASSVSDDQTIAPPQTSGAQRRRRPRAGRARGRPPRTGCGRGRRRRAADRTGRATAQRPREHLDGEPRDEPAYDDLRVHEARRGHHPGALHADHQQDRARRQVPAPQREQRGQKRKAVVRMKLATPAVTLGSVASSSPIRGAATRR